MNDPLALLAFLAAAAALAVGVAVWLKVRRPAGGEAERVLRDELRHSREEASRQARELREEVAGAQARANEALTQSVAALGREQKEALERSGTAVAEWKESTLKEFAAQRERVQAQMHEIQKMHEERLDRVQRVVDEKLRQGMDEQKKHLQEVLAALKGMEKSQREDQQKAREELDAKFRLIQEGNERKLEEMRQTVDEKLHKTLDQRLGESFKLVSERLEAVQNGLGEMRTLATGVGDLKRVLTNVKDRGTWGEYQLEAILADLLTPDQYGRNVQPKEGGERVEFALKLPGRGGDGAAPVWLPIDAKFPKEDYERLVQAAERADGEAVKASAKALADEIRRCAREIRQKYIAPPATTDFAVMFLPTEGLYAEVLRQPGLHDELQREHRVLAAGPATLAAMLNSLRMGFQTLAIEKRASEVWTILSAVKTEFGKFGETLDKVKRQLHQATTTIDKTFTRTRAMERKLREVEGLPAGEAEQLLGMEAAGDGAGPAEEDGDDSPA